MGSSGIRNERSYSIYAVSERGFILGSSEIYYDILIAIDRSKEWMLTMNSCRFDLIEQREVETLQFDESEKKYKIADWEIRCQVIAESNDGINWTLTKER